MSEITAEVLEPLTYGYGARDRIYVANPAAGANASLKVTKAGAYNVLSVVCTVVTDANVANRWLELDYQTDAGFVYCRNGGAPTFPASTTLNFCFKIGMGLSDFANTGSDYTPICYPLAPFAIPQGDTLALVLGNKQATDQISAIAFTLEEIFEGPRGYRVGRVPGS